MSSISRKLEGPYSEYYYIYGFTRKDRADYLITYNFNINRIDDNNYTVQSQTTIGVYYKCFLDGRNDTCDCKDHQYNKGKLRCKHVLAIYEKFKPQFPLIYNM